GAGHVRLRNIKSPALQQILKIETGKFAFARCDGDGGGAAHLGLAGVIVGRHRLLEPGDVVGLELPGKLDGGGDLEGTVSVDHELDVGAEPAARRHDPAHALGN